MRTIAVLAVALVTTAMNVAINVGEDITITVTDVTTAVWEGESPSNGAIAESSESCYTTSSSSTTTVSLATSQVSSSPLTPTTPAPAAPVAISTTTPSTTSTLPAVSATGYNSPNDDTYAQRVLDHHNIHRQNNSAGALTWDSNLASIAQQIASSCYYAHNTGAGGGGYGQNIAAGAPADNITSVITDQFYNGEIMNFEGMYGQPTPYNINIKSALESYGHYTQVVWAATTAVGCATVDCTSQGLANVGSDVPPYFTVCNYSPPGNYLGEFADNVLEPGDMPTIDWSYKY